MKKEKTISVLFLVQSAMIAAIYVVLTIVFAPISFGQIQFRIAEALTILPAFTPAAIPRLPVLPPAWSVRKHLAVYNPCSPDPRASPPGHQIHSPC